MNLKRFFTVGVILRAVWFVACSLLVILFVSELVFLHTHPEEYEMLWGAAPLAEWWYGSYLRYAALTAVETLWYCFGMLLCCCSRFAGRRFLLPAHVVISILWLFFLCWVLPVVVSA